MHEEGHSEAVLLILLLAALILGGIGFLASPLDGNGRPLLLLPDVKKVEDYRRSARSWTAQMRTIDSLLSTLLAGQGDLLSQSQSGQAIFEESLNLAKGMDAAEAPAALVGLKSMLADTALAYLEASRAGLLWISTPQQENYDQAVLLLQAARAQLSELEASSWINP